MRRDIKRKIIAISIIVMIFNFPILVSGREQEKKTEIEEKEVKEAEDTMLNIMPFLKIPKKTAIKYSIVQQFEYLDNYYLSKDDRKGRFVSISSPSVSLRYPMGRSYLEGRYAYGFTYYIGHDKEIHRHNAMVRIYHRPTRRFSIGLSEEFLRNDQPEYEKDIDVKAAGKTFNRNKVHAQAKYVINRRWRCGAEGSYSFIYFDERAPGATPDRTEFGGGGDMEYVIDRRTTAGIVYNFYDTVFDKADKKDSYKHTVHLRCSHKMRKAFTVNAHGGYDFINYENDDDLTGVSAGTDLNFNISRFTKFVFKYDYSFNDSSREDYQAYRYHGLDAGFKHHLTPRFIINTISSYGLRLYDSRYDISSSGGSSDKISHIVGFNCTVDYKLTKKIDIGANYNMNAKFSDFSDDTYFSNHYMITLKATF